MQHDILQFEREAFSNFHGETTILENFDAPFLIQILRTKLNPAPFDSIYKMFSRNCIY